jgi:hypothetical protein
MGVFLSSTNFDESHPPVITTDEVMPARYQLRAKFIDQVTGSPLQATNLFQNNGLRLDQLPHPAVYVTVVCYWIQYNDALGTRTIGPDNPVSGGVTITPSANSCPNPTFPTIGSGTPSTLCVCGTFDAPLVPDDHGCSPAVVKRDCEAPAPPQAECGESGFSIIYTPGATPPFQVVSVLFDSNCDAILDQGGNEILTLVE